MTQLRVDQLGGHLKQSLASVYFVHGDESLLVNECADAIRAAARAQTHRMMSVTARLTCLFAALLAGTHVARFRRR